MRWFYAGQFTVCLPLLVLAGCNPRDKPVVQCEGVLKAMLKAPASYHLVESLVGSAKSNGTQDVFITYDAVNSYNAPLRERFWCIYDLHTGTAKSADAGVGVAPDNVGIEQPVPPIDKPAVRNAKSKNSSPSLKSGPQSYEDEVPVCDRPDSPEKFALMNELGVGCGGE